MDSQARSVLTEVGLPEHIFLLLDLYGVRTLQDLSALNSSIIEEVESCVKNGTFEGIVDLEDKTNRLKYLGFDYKSIDSFKFQPMDTMKLLKVPDIVKNSLGTAPAPVKNLKVEPNDDISISKAYQAAKTIMLKFQSLFERLDLKEDDIEFDFNFTHTQTIDNLVIQVSCPKSRFAKLDGDNSCAAYDGDQEIDVLPLEVKIEKVEQEQDPIEYNQYFQPEQVNFSDFSHLGNLGYEMNHADDDNNEEPEIESEPEPSPPVKKNPKFTLPPRVRNKKPSSSKSGRADLDAGLVIKYIDGVKFYQCDVCGKDNFLQRRKMKQHRLIHTTERNVSWLAIQAGNVNSILI